MGEDTLETGLAEPSAMKGEMKNSGEKLLTEEGSRSERGVGGK